jgi:hypothetical protein
MNEKIARWPASSALPLLPMLLVLLAVSQELAAKRNKELLNFQWRGQFKFSIARPVATTFHVTS